MDSAGPHCRGSCVVRHDHLAGAVYVLTTSMTRLECLLLPAGSVSSSFNADYFVLTDTEIDWKTYMQQVSQFLDGEYDYSKLKGDTGPLVYPVYHLYLYTALYYLTDRGTNIFRAQCIFAVLYLVTLAFVMAAYRRAGAPSWLLFPLVLSKRLHSIFLLRLFNDTWATLTLWISIWALQKRWWEVGTLVWGVGVGIKMTMLLLGPAITVILIQGSELSNMFFLEAYSFLLHLAASYPFLYREVGFTYFRCAFDFGRQFMYKWTVNWKFVPEQIFLSRTFAVTLLVTHVSLLLLYMHNRWVRPSSKSIPEFIKKFIIKGIDYREEVSISNKITPQYVTDAILSSVVVGLLCARTLHYQFYAYLGWATPYLLWRTKMPFWLLLPIWGAQEYCWLVYPSTEWSSGAVVILLVVQLMASFYAPEPALPPDHTEGEVKAPPK